MIFENFKKVVRYAALFFANLIYWISFLVPRDKSLWLFSSWNGEKFADNPKFVYLYVSSNHTDIRAVWLAKSRRVCEDLKRQGVNAVYTYGVKGALMQLRCGVVVFSHSIRSEFIPFLLSSDVLKVQTWHGIPLKKIGNDDEKDKRKAVFDRYLNLIFPFLEERYSLVTACGSEDYDKFRVAFDVDVKDVVVTGYPRNDALMNDKEKVLGNGLKVVYMPTFRGRPYSDFKLFEETNFNFTLFDQMLSEADVDFYVRLHPVQRLSKKNREEIGACKKLHILDEVDDVYEMLGSMDCLVTDFSSIMFDFLVTNKPIIHAPFNIDEYLINDRSMYYQYSEVCSSQPVHDWDAVFTLLGLLGRDEYKMDLERYRKVKRRFHKYSDANSSSRVCLEIRKRIGISNGT